MRGDGNIAVPSIMYGRGTQTYARLSVEVRGRGRAAARPYNINVENNLIVGGLAKSSSRASETSCHLPSIKLHTAEQMLS